MQLRAEKLVKIYGQREVVKSVSINVNQGEIVGLLGPNGAGKTTTFYMVVGFIQPNQGHVFLDSFALTSILVNGPLLLFFRVLILMLIVSS